MNEGGSSASTLQGSSSAPKKAAMHASTKKAQGHGMRVNKAGNSIPVGEFTTSNSFELLKLPKPAQGHHNQRSLPENHHSAIDEPDTMLR